MNTTKIRRAALALLVMLAGMVFATPEIRNVTAKQRYPWNGKVDISFEVVGDLREGLPADKYPELVVSATDNATSQKYVAEESALSGDTGWAEEKHHVVWDMDAQGIVITSTNVAFTVTYREKYWLYSIIDLSSGADATSYPVAYTNDAPADGFNTDEYKTTKLVLRRIDPGTFKMCGEYDVTLTKPYYMGGFEVTQRQYELVMGSNPSDDDADGRHPVECVSWNDSSTFMGKVQERTGLSFSLPTEAQWEYACRAGTTSAYNNGGDSEDDLKLLGQYNADTHAVVGSYQANAWGLYDMHGNVWEWCLDYWAASLSGETDPVGASSGTSRVMRGGSWDDDADNCTSSHRDKDSSSYADSICGFRLSRTLSSTEDADPLGTGDSVAVTIDSRTGERASSGDETLAYSSLWDGDGEATVTITQKVTLEDGDHVETLAEGLTGPGDHTWTAPYDHPFVLTHTTYKDGNVIKEETASFVVTGKNIPFDFDKGEVTVTTYSDKYDGEAHGIKVESELTEFVVKYASSQEGEFGDTSPTITNVGTLQVWYEISALGRLTETNSATVAISPREVTLTSGTATNVYNGAAFTCHEVAVSGDGFVGDEGASCDYTGAQTAVGTSANTFTYTLNDGTKAENYVVGTSEGTLTVTPKTLTDEMVTVSDEEMPYVYDGNAKEPSVTVTDGDPSILAESDYEVAYTNNVNAGVATATVIVTGKANYTGAVTNHFDIAKAEVPKPATPESKVYTGDPLTADLEGTDLYTVTNDGGTDVGEYDVELTLTDPDNYRWAEGDSEPLELTFEITKATYDMSAAQWTGESFTYDGDEKSIEVEGLPSGVTASYEGNVATNAGSYTAKATLAYDEKNYNEPSIASQTWTILQADIDQQVTSYDGIYDGEGHGIEVNVTMNTDDEARTYYAADQAGPYSEEPILFTNVTETVVWYVVEAANYNAVTNSGTVKISPKQLTEAMVSVTGGVLGEEEPKVTVADGDPSILTEDDYDVSIEGYGVGDMKITVTGKSNYTGEVVKDTGVVVAGEGTVTPPKTLKPKQKATWKATAAKGSVFAHWEGEFVEALNLSRNELRNPSLALSLDADFDPEKFDPEGIQAVFISIDSDRLSELGLSQTELEPNEAVSGLALLDDSESYVTASVNGLPTGLKFDAKTLAITGTPTKPGVYTVKITAKNASGYQWAENLEMRVADIEDAHIDFTGLPDTAAVGEDYNGQIAAGEFKTLKASGFPAGLKFDAKTGKVAGKPTKGGYFTVAVTATYADKSKADATLLMTVAPVPSIPEPKRTPYYPLTTISSDPQMGTATGTGVYAEGKKVSISAKAAKNCVFAGWYRDAALAQPMEFASGDFRKASQSVVVPEERYIFASFVSSEADKGSIELTVNDAEMLPAGGDQANLPCTNYCGVAVNWPLAATALSEPTVKAAGLPTGVKLVQDKKTGAYSLAGVPTAASKADKSGNLTPAKVKLTVTTAGKSSQVYEFDWVVLPLPDWAVGTFDGSVFDADDASVTVGLVQALTVSAAGKISGKLIDATGTWTLSAASFDSVDDDLVFRATVIGKNGKLVFTNEMTVAEEDLHRADDEKLYSRGVVSGGPQPSAAAEAPTWIAWQNLWKTEPWKTDAKPFAKAPVLTLYVVDDETDGRVVLDALPEGVSPYGTLSLKFDGSGTVKTTAKFVTGKDSKGKDIVYSASCSSALIPAEEGTYSVSLYIPPKAGKFDEGYAVEVPLVWDGSNFTVKTDAP